MKAYALITAARNEEKHIEKTLKSVISQTVLPRKWIIVSDGSTDRTDELVRPYAEAFSSIQFVHLKKNHQRNFASAVLAQNFALQMLALEEFDFLGLLDGDVSLPPNYYQDLFEKFSQNPLLGLAGGFIFEKRKGQFVPEKHNRTRCVAGAVQMFRRECYQDIGPYLPIKYGGADACAEVACRMKGWVVQSFPELEVRHFRPTGSAGGIMRSWYRQGFMDYALGSHPIFEMVKLVSRIPCRPVLLGSLVRSYAYIVANLRHEERMVSPEFVVFLRKEQKERLRLLAGGHII